jgi:N-methylhydantoinase B
MLTIDGETRDLPGKVTMSVQKQCLVTHVQAGAGGYGDPFERDPALVLEDVLDGKITRGFARERHGVEIDAHGRIDVEATRAARGNRAA